MELWPLICSENELDVGVGSWHSRVAISVEERKQSVRSKQDAVKRDETL